jgi:hypothetical protein
LRRTLPYDYRERHAQLSTGPNILATCRTESIIAPATRHVPRERT